MGTTPVFTVDATGAHLPDFATVLTWAQAQYQAIYGADVVLTPDTQDGQWVGILAAAINDCNLACAATYNAFSPATAHGAGLSSVVKINGLLRNSATYSSADLLLVGQAGTIITSGLVSDANGYQWALPATVTIPLAGQITATATCKTIGAIAAPAGTITGLFTPTAGWQTATNLSPASVGAPVQTDAQLRIVQGQSTMLPAQTGMDSLVGAVKNVAGVTAVQYFENDTTTVDANGLPPRSIALVVTGGDAVAIAQTILLKKMSGATTYGTTSEIVSDPYGVNRQINFFRPTAVAISFVVQVHGLVGFTSDVEAAIQSALAAWVNGFVAGVSVSLSRAYSPVNAVGTSFEVVPNSILIGVNGATPVAADGAILFNQQATCLASAVTITVV